MNTTFNQLYEDVIRVCCDEEVCGRNEPSEKCNCGVFSILEQIKNLGSQSLITDDNMPKAPCVFCKHANDIWWLTDAGGLRASNYCPECGRKLKEG